jgi:hypothetical protein
MKFAVMGRWTLPTFGCLLLLWVDSTRYQAVHNRTFVESRDTGISTASLWRRLNVCSWRYADATLSSRAWPMPSPAAPHPAKAAAASSPRSTARASRRHVLPRWSGLPASP